MAVVLDNRYSRSFSDALSLARNRRDQGIIYYFKDGVRALYEATTAYSARPNNTGTIIIRGRVVTRSDVPPDMSPPTEQTGTNDFLVANNARAAKRIFDHNGIDTSTGWDLRP